ncbi:MAG TPA: SCP2 sterol-binding domain-containing protein [Saprospiraceae bacterium]|nr:SCP2 sterol-binding domain-containing protein [Lewinellaceae bacterium]HPG05695.1 SCP2 sterol-binding domain-containing protein [Saprospiraceae bacterium]HPR00598.1 SCP2 sterol-binding domain-containing protein [Saprospiraceae bacterium]HRV83272.1 SCP2 sterol-binding domain-containing protein [Saprospiraceae bacterium]
MIAKDFIFKLPEKVRKEAVEGMETTFHFELSGDDGGDFTLSLKDGVLTADEGLVGEPKCVVKSSGDNFMKVVTGELNPLMAILTGKLKVSNQGEMVRYAKIFGLM